MMRSAFDMVSACASVLATTNSQPWSPLVIMLLTALPPAPPVPNTVIRGLSSRMSGLFKLMLMCASSCRKRKSAPGRAGPPPADGCVLWSSEALAKPSSDPCDIAACPCLRVPRSPRFEMFEMGRLRLDEQAGGRRECGSFGFLGKARDAEWAADTH